MSHHGECSDLANDWLPLAFFLTLCLLKGKASWTKKQHFGKKKCYWLLVQQAFSFSSLYSAHDKVSCNRTFPCECGKLHVSPPSNSADFVCLQWMMGNVVQRDDDLYARMKQREIDAYDSLWDPIFVDDAALGVVEQRTKVLEVLKVKTLITKMSSI